MSRLLDMFVDESPESAHTKVVIVDKDFTEISAIKAAFSSSLAIQLSVSCDKSLYDCC